MKLLPDMKKIDLSIIIVSYNTRKLLRSCLKSIFKSLKGAEVEFEVIVIDNNSVDLSCEMITREFPEVRLVKNRENLGFGKANNQGVQIAQAETLLFLNSDTEVLNDAIGKLYTNFYKLTQPVIIGGKLFNTDKSPQPSCGPAYSLLNIFIALFLKGDYIGITRYSPNKLKQVDWVMGACFMVSKTIFNSVGGFDEDIFMYMEEIDFEYRARKKGVRIYFSPEGHFLHAGASSSQGRSTPILNVFKGLIYFYDKHYSIAEKITLRILLVFKSILAIILFSLLSKKYDRNLYMKALRLII